MAATRMETGGPAEKEGPGVGNDLLEKLRTVTLFKDLTAAELSLIGGEMRLKQKKAGHKLLIQGKPVPAVFIIHEGLVDILVNDDRVAQRGPMDSLGEMSCFSGEATASATAETITPCQVWEIDRQAFMSVIDVIPTLRSRMFTTITGRLATISHRFSEILKHIPHGIIKIDLEGKITDEFSSRCTDYFGITQLTGQKIGKLLFSDNDALSERWDEAIQLFVGNAGSSLNDRLEHLPEVVTYRHPDGIYRIFRLFYHITVDADNQINGLDIGIDDVTQARQNQSEYSSFQKMVSKLEQLLILINVETGLIVQETLSHSQQGQTHFPTWKNLKGKEIFNTILRQQPQDQLVHFQRWLKMLVDKFVLEAMSIDDLQELAPRFSFETALGKVMELSFMLNPPKTGVYTEAIGRFEFLETEQAPQEFQYSTMDLMDEVLVAEGEHQLSLLEALNEMQISLEIAQSQMLTPNDLAINRKQVAGLIHSVKGQGQSFGLSTVATASHEVEDLLEETLKRGYNPTVISQLHTAFKSLLSLIVVSKSLCSVEKTKDLGESRSREPEISIPLAKIQQLQQSLKNLLDHKTGAMHNEAKAALLKLQGDISMLQQVDLRAVFPRLQRIVTDTGRLLHKQVEFRVWGKIPVWISLKTGHRLTACLIQLVKNAVCHGIETPSDRKFLGKTDMARIELLIKKSDTHLRLSVRDDGQGIRLVKTVARALQLNLITQEKAVQMRLENRPEEILALLFEPGFSSAASMSLFSGRGVGMSLIQTEMASLGGSVVIESQENKGTFISLEVPNESGEFT